MASTFEGSGYLTGQVLIAMPQMQDPRFAHSVVYLCAHSSEGAMGLVVNRLFESITFPDLLEQLSIEPAGSVDAIRVHFGGPVDASRGFVLHSTDYLQETTMVVDDTVALTATVDVLKAIADGKGPRNALLALGYAGWGAGQLDDEMLANSWLTAPADDDLLFGLELESKWDRALGKLGITSSLLSGEAGHA
jgi:putative transcriptional regulator